MNPQVVAAIIGGIAGFVGAVLGSGIAAMVTWVVAQRQRQHEERMAEQERRQVLRITALDKRLQAHQEAYSLWYELIWASGGKDDQRLDELTREAEKWWRDNCLYLDELVRVEFGKCIHRASTRQQQLKAHADSEELERLYQRMLDVGSLIEESVGLPPIGDFDGLLPGKVEESESRDQAE